METVILMVMIGVGLFINFGFIHFGWACITGDWSDWKDAVGFIFAISVIVSLGVLIS